MAYLFNGATHIINRADSVLQTWPITMHGRIRLTGGNDGLVHCIMGMWEAGADNGFRLQVERVASNMTARCGSKASGSASNANSTTNMNDTNWHSVIGEISAANARQVWLDNAGNATNTTSLTPGTLTKTSVGAHDNGGTLSGNIAHELADVALWSVALTTEEREALKNGLSPALIRPDKLEIYLPLMRSATDFMGGAFTVTAATVADHPRVYMPARSRIVSKAGAVIGATGTSVETDTALSLAAVQIKAAGVGLETDAALALSSARPVGLATETDSALALTSGSAAPVGLASETGTAISLAGVSVRALGLSVETDSALALGALAIRPVGLASSTEASLLLGSAMPAAPANDNEVALSLVPVSARQCGVSAEVETAQPCLPVQLRLVGASIETDAALALSPGAYSVGLATETNTSLALAGATVSRLTGPRPAAGASRLRTNLSTGARPAAISRG